MIAATYPTMNTALNEMSHNAVSIARLGGMGAEGNLGRSRCEIEEFTLNDGESGWVWNGGWVMESGWVWNGSAGGPAGFIGESDGANGGCRLDSGWVWNGSAQEPSNLL